MWMSNEIWVIVLSAGITIFSLNLLIISLLSYKKFRNIKLLLMSLVFLLFFIRGLILSINVITGITVDLASIVYLWLFDLLILVFLYVTSLKR
jgi:hypothetical protein